jgi:hypothetical protein
MQDLKHEAVATEGDDDTGLFGWRVAVEASETLGGPDRVRSLAGDEGDRKELALHESPAAERWSSGRAAADLSKPFGALREALSIEPAGTKRLSAETSNFPVQALDERAIGTPSPA